MKRFMLQFVDLTIFSIQTLLVCVEEFSYLTLVIIHSLCCSLRHDQHFAKIWLWKYCDFLNCLLWLFVVMTTFLFSHEVPV